MEDQSCPQASSLLHGAPPFHYSNADGRGSSNQLFKPFTVLVISWPAFLILYCNLCFSEDTPPPPSTFQVPSLDSGRRYDELKATHRFSPCLGLA